MRLGKELRASPRREINAQLLIRSSDEGPYTVLNISDSGLCMIGSDPIEPGRTAEATLFLPEGAISLSIEVIWSEPGSAASSFVIGSRHNPRDIESKELLGAFLQDLRDG